MREQRFRWKLRLIVEREKLLPSLSKSASEKVKRAVSKLLAITLGLQNPLIEIPNRSLYLETTLKKVLKCVDCYPVLACLSIRRAHPDREVREVLFEALSGCDIFEIYRRLCGPFVSEDDVRAAHEVAFKVGASGLCGVKLSQVEDRAVL